MNNECVFLLNQCPPAGQASHVQKGIAALEAVGVVLRSHVRAGADFLEAAHTGKGVTEVDQKGAPAQEMRDLWLAFKRRLRPIQTCERAEPITRRSWR